MTLKLYIPVYTCLLYPRDDNDDDDDDDDDENVSKKGWGKYAADFDESMVKFIIKLYAS